MSQRASEISRDGQCVAPHGPQHSRPSCSILWVTQIKNKDNKLGCGRNEFNVTWSRILGSSSALYRESSELSRSSYVLCVDWSGDGVAFSLYLGKRLVYLDSPRNKSWSDHVSSFLGEADAVAWSLRQSLWIIRGSWVIMRTNSESRKKLNNPASWVPESDARVLRVLWWLLGNFVVGTQLTFEYIPCKDNIIANQLSRWQLYKVEEETLPEQYGIKEIYTMPETEAIGLTEDITERRLGISARRPLWSTKDLAAKSPIRFENIIPTNKTTTTSV